MKGMAGPAAGAADTRECMDQYGQVGDETTPGSLPFLMVISLLACHLSMALESGVGLWFILPYLRKMDFPSQKAMTNNYIGLNLICMGKQFLSTFPFLFLKIKNLCQDGGFAKSKAFSPIH